MSNHIIRNASFCLTASDWDSNALIDIASGKGFRITEKGVSDIDHQGGFYSIHSPLYGSDYKDDHAFEDRYSCRCGAITGMNYKGVVCKKCKTPVEFVDIDMTKTGWIILDNDYIIQSLFFKKIKSYIGDQVLENMLKFVDPLERKEVPNQPYAGIGIIEFRERFVEIMNHYYKNTPKKKGLYMFIMSQPGLVFTHSIPVYSSHLRLFVVRDNKIRYSKEDKLYKTIFTNHQMLNDDFELTRRVKRYRSKIANSTEKKYDVDYLRRENILYRIQKDLDKLWDLSFETIKKKSGVIRNSILGGRINNTARNVIIPDKTLRADQITLGYTTVLELYKHEIISLLVKLQGISHKEAWDKWQKATTVFDETIYHLMDYMAHNDKRPMIVEIDRNPTIDYGSQVVVRIVNVTPEMDDFTMGLPVSILTGMNADFDGDVLNIITLKLDSLIDQFYSSLNPRYNMFIDRNDGTYSTKTGLLKDQLIGLYAFANS